MSRSVFDPCLGEVVVSADLSISQAKLEVQGDVSLFYKPPRQPCGHRHPDTF